LLIRSFEAAGELAGIEGSAGVGFATVVVVVAAVLLMYGLFNSLSKLVKVGNISSNIMKNILEFFRK
jgi:hypothetical protein